MTPSPGAPPASAVRVKKDQVGPETVVEYVEDQEEDPVHAKEERDEDEEEVRVHAKEDRDACEEEVPCHAKEDRDEDDGEVRVHAEQDEDEDEEDEEEEEDDCWSSDQTLPMEGDACEACARRPALWGLPLCRECQNWD